MHSPIHSRELAVLRACVQVRFSVPKLGPHVVDVFLDGEPMPQVQGPHGARSIFDEHAHHELPHP